MASRGISSEQLKLLLESEGLLGASLEAEETLTQLRRLLVPQLADGCSLWLGEGRTEGQGRAIADDAARRWVAGRTGRARKAGEGTRWLRGTAPERLAEQGLEQARIELVSELAASSLVAVPLVARGRGIGLLLVWHAESERHHDEGDVVVLEQLASRAGLALDNARLYREALQAQAAAAAAAAGAEGVRSLAEEAAQRSEEARALLDAVFSHSPVGKAFLDRRLRFERVNEACAQLLGHSLEECLGRGWDELWPGDDKAPKRRLRAALGGKTSSGVELEGAGGRRLLASFSPVHGGRKILGVGVVMLDITDRALAKEARDQALASLDSLFENSPVGIAFFDRDMRYERVNEALLKMSGGSREERLGHTIGEFSSAHAPLEPLVRQALEQGTVSTVELARVVEGEERSLVATFYPVRSEHGETLGAGAMLADISGLRHAEREQQRALAYLDALVANAPIGIAFYDRELRYRHVNQALVEMGGGTVEDRLGRTIGEFRKSNRVERYVREALAGKLSLGVEISEEIDGEERHFLASYYPVPAASGEIEGAAVIALDVTESKRLERERDDAREREREGAARHERLLALFEAVIAGAPVGIGIYDERLLFRHANQALAGINGRPIAEHIGRPIEAVLGHDPRHAAQVRRNLKRVLREGVPVVGVELRLERDGEALHLVATWFPISLGSGERVGVAEIVQDVTDVRRVAEERRQFEEVLVQAQKMEAIGRLAGGVAHDFNNLLTIILGYSHRLANRRDDEEIARAGREIEQAALSGSHLVKQMLAFGRRQLLEPRTIDLNEIVAELRSMLGSMLGGAIELRLDLQPKLHQVRADPTQIEQVLVNLVANAGDAMPAGGELRIRTRDVELEEAVLQGRALRAGPYVLLEVEDTGTGMDALTLAHAFEPFFTTKEVGKGTGLGLASVYGAIEQSGGLIELTSELGKGTRASIHLPVAAPARENHGDHSNGKTILLVEDDEGVRALAETVLAEAGYDVLSAGSGSEALELAAANGSTVDLLVSDVVMPEMTGPQLAQRLRADRPALPVLFMSGYADDVLRQRVAFHAGEVPLRKPFLPDELLARVKDALERRQPPRRMRPI